MENSDGKLHVAFNIKSEDILVPVKSCHYIPTEIWCH